MRQRLNGAISGSTQDVFARRKTPAAALATDAAAVASACYEMALRWHRGGKLVVFGMGSASTDAQHIAVEFVHPVIVGKRALPAISLAGDIATVTGVAARDGLDEVFAHQIRHLAAPEDIALGVSARGIDGSVQRGLEQARAMGLLTIALTGPDPGVSADHSFAVPSDDPLIVKEVQVTTYHVLWELVHVFFEQPGLLP